MGARIKLRRGQGLKRAGWGLRVWGLLAALVCIIGLGTAATAAPNSSTPIIITVTGEEAPGVVERLVDAASRQGRPVELRLMTPAAQAAMMAPLSPDAERSGWALLTENFMIGTQYGWDSVPYIPRLGDDLIRAWGDIRNRGSPLQAMGVALAIVLGSALAGYSLMRGVRVLWPRARLDWRPTRPDSALIERVAGGLATWLSHILGLCLFLLLSQTLSARLLPEPDLARWIAEGVSAVAIGFIAYVATAEFLLAPGRPACRVMPMPNAEFHARCMRFYGFIGPSILFTVELFGRIGSSPLAIAGWFSLFGGAITVYKLWWFWVGRRDIRALCLGAEPVSAARRVMASALPTFLIASAVLIWAVGRVAAVAPDGARWANAAGATQILLVLIPITAAGLGALIREWIAHMPCSETGLVGTNPIIRAWALVAATTAGAAVWILGLWVLSRLWQFFLAEIFTPTQVAALEGPISVIAVFLVGWIIWTFLSALFTAYAPTKNATGPVGPDAEEEGAEPQVRSRFGTILPLLRAVVLAAVIGLTVLVGLSRLGIDISPLLAGFGILGLAISFGSQALVRDIVSGIFFIADDAFRVGEYINTGRLKGTVERITLRSVQLRHQSGLVHTIPFGQISSVTNSSREWATVKFNIRLDRETDIEVARKTIKRVGLAMAEMPEFAPLMILPLKMQGVAAIDDTAIVVRLKFTSKPDRASWLQREALKRVYAALRDAGVIFASNAVTVRGGTEGQPAGAAANFAGTPAPGVVPPAV
ncbi:mechanosensitive ion channel family protein [Elstera sp.]|uniref:mechanosensitive ion channel family protein n=1 Tax=Elstera sp. TaxID=1916664 RepID=UPI0037BF47C6